MGKNFLSKFYSLFICWLFSNRSPSALYTFRSACTTARAAASASLEIFTTPPPPPAVPGIESCTLQKIRYDKIDFLFLFLRSTVGIEIAPSGFETNTFATTPMVHNNKLLTKLESIHIALSCFVQFINCFSWPEAFHKLLGSWVLRIATARKTRYRYMFCKNTYQSPVNCMLNWFIVSIVFAVFIGWNKS